MASPTMAGLLLSFVLAGCLLGACPNFGGGMPADNTRQVDIGQPRFTPQWTPDGERILFVLGYNGGDMYTAASDGTSLRLLNREDLVVKRADADEVYLNSPDVSPDGSRIVYTTGIPRHGWRFGDETWDWEIETSRPDGSDRIRLTENSVEETSPVWSPDGSRIAFERIGPGSPEFEPDTFIYTMAADGSDVRALLRTSDHPLADSYYFTTTSRHTLEWSPDGTMLAIELVEEVVPNPDRNDSGRPPPPHFLYTLGADGSSLTEVFTVPDSRESIIISGPSWSPDGKKIAFIMWTATTAEATLYTVSPDGSDLKELDRRVPSGRPGRHPSLQWSPDGGQMLLTWGRIREQFRRNEYAYKPPVQVIDADGTNLRTVAVGTNASWSPDGARIATLDAYRELEGLPYLSTVAADGSDVRVLVRRTEGGDELQAENRRCFLWFCR